MYLRIGEKVRAFAMARRLPLKAFTRFLLEGDTVMAAIIGPEVEIVKRFPMISWGAVFAGLFFVITASWLLFLLGSAIGVGIADASDLEAMGKGFGVGA